MGLLVGIWQQNPGELPFRASYTPRGFCLWILLDLDSNLRGLLPQSFGLPFQIF